MAKETKKQQDVVERVMHEFKHGELETSTGRKVTNAKQAIAIGLSEAGASNRESPKKNRQNLKRTETRERKGQTARQRDEENPTKSDLYAEAKNRNVPGRSSMDKAQLQRALAR